MTQAIAVENLQVQYRSKSGKTVDAVKDLTFEVRTGEVVGFLGPNGAGKSSTLKALMGFVEPAAGSCRVFGLPAGGLDAKRRVGYLPEVALYYPFLTPLETLTLYGELQGLHGRALREEAHQLLELVGLKDAGNKHNRNLSKGMLQRVGIAQSLLGGPELLILDEVTSGLDPIGRQELRSLLHSRQRAGCTLFFSSHELSEVEMICDRILLIDQGRLLEERELASLKEELRRHAVVFQGNTALFDLASLTEALSPGVVRATFASKPDMLRALDRLHHEGAEILDIVAQEGSLETYFIEKIREAA